MNRLRIRKWTPVRVDRNGRPIGNASTDAPPNPSLVGIDNSGQFDLESEIDAMSRAAKAAVGLFWHQVFIAEVRRLTTSGSVDLLTGEMHKHLPEIGAVVIIETAADKLVSLGDMHTIQAVDWNWSLAIELTHRQVIGDRAVLFGSFMGARLRLG